MPGIDHSWLNGLQDSEQGVEGGQGRWDGYDQGLGSCWRYTESAALFYSFDLKKKKKLIINWASWSKCEIKFYSDSWRLHFQAPRRHFCFQPSLRSPQASTQPEDVPPLHSLNVQLPSACDLDHGTGERRHQTRWRHGWCFHWLLDQRPTERSAFKNEVCWELDCPWRAVLFFFFFGAEWDKADHWPPARTI